MVKKVILPVIALIIVVSLAAYALNGGFSKVEVKRQVSERKYIAGVAYSGPVRSRDISNIFQRAGELVETGKLKGNLGGIYYNNPAGDKGVLKAFIGVVVSDPDVALPEGYELRVLEAGRPVLRAQVKASYTLIPGKAYPALFGFAKENNLELKEEYFEEFYSKEEGAVEVTLAKAD